MPIRPRSSIEPAGDRSREPVTEGSDEGRRARREDRDRSSDVTPVTDRGSATPDAAAIEVARARAIAAGVTAREEEQKEDRPVFDFATRSKDTVMGVGKGGLQVLSGSLVVAGYLGYQASRPVLFTVAHALDWIGRKMNSWADKLIDKKIPILNWLINPLVSILDSSAKALGIDKTLVEHLKKNKEDRKKLAQKVFKDYMETQKKAEKKTDDASAKAKRRKVIEEKLGPDVAAVILDDVDATAAAAATDSKAGSAPVEAAKAA